MSICSQCKKSIHGIQYVDAASEERELYCQHCVDVYVGNIISRTNKVVRPSNNTVTA